MAGYKLCSKCKELKCYDNFHFDRSKKDGLGSCCKICTKLRQAAIAKSAKPILSQKTCTKCGITKPSKSFGKDAYSVDGLTPQCKLCAKEWRINNPNNVRNCTLKREYGIDLLEYEAVAAKQNNLCILCVAISPMPSGGKRLAVDHDHETGKVRGLLCNIHNMALGKLGDTAKSIEIVLKYLQGKL